MQRDPPSRGCLDGEGSQTDGVRERTTYTGFEEFFQVEYPRTVKAVYLLTGSRAEAEDLAQEALARAYERWDRVRVMESPGGYVYRTAVNLNRKRLRRLAAAARRVFDPPAENDPMSAVEARSETVRLLMTLPKSQREALILVDWLGMGSEEAGRLLRIRPASVRSRVHRARAVLRERFGGSDE